VSSGSLRRSRLRKITICAAGVRKNDVSEHKLDFFVVKRRGTQMLIPSCPFFRPVFNDVRVWYYASNSRAYREIETSWRCALCGNAILTATLSEDFVSGEVDESD